jgi:signal transduction histidine kinase
VVSIPFLKFSVDSHLLEELGKRLVGKPYIALAELVKNSYDADATEVTVELDPTNGRIVVSDNGHGMTFEEFQSYWMRVGSRHKEELKFSRRFRRHLTGSKGIGRLAVQYLAKDLQLVTLPEKDETELEAQVKWEEAVNTGNLTEAKVEYHTKSVAPAKPGTTISLSGLNHLWDKDAVQGLAKEIWWLRPPFRRTKLGARTAQEFDIIFVSPSSEFADTFRQQMDAILDIWYARLVGKNDRGNVTMSLQFGDEDPITQSYDIPPPCTIVDGAFEIRIYKLHGRLRRGLRVASADEYLKEFGGVHVYDGGFHLPYYGAPENDWLRVEFDHSHRLSSSGLLPKELQVPEGMNYLPTLSRILGAVNVDTSIETDLKIAITRDRLQEGTALTNLQFMTRWALDFYAVNEKVRSEKDALAEKETETTKFQHIEDVLSKYSEDIPKATYEQLRNDVRKVSSQIESQAETTSKRIGIVAPLATAGIASLAFQHELKQQFAGFGEIIYRIDKLKNQIEDPRVVNLLQQLKEDLTAWIERARMTNALFAYFGQAENIQIRERFPAVKVIPEIWRQVEFLARGTSISIDGLADDLVLPKASLVEWSSIFQNVFLNAFNAMIGSKKKLIDVRSRKMGREIEILVQDTGIGVNRRDVDKLFQPFVRQTNIPLERKTIGYGGTGLGLTIVRLVAQNVGASVTFSQPDKGFQTAFSLKWRESS